MSTDTNAVYDGLKAKIQNLIDNSQGEPDFVGGLETAMEVIQTQQNLINTLPLNVGEVVRLDELPENIAKIAIDLLDQLNFQVSDFNQTSLVMYFKNRNSANLNYDDFVLGGSKSKEYNPLVLLRVDELTWTIKERARTENNITVHPMDFISRLSISQTPTE